ncbi:MAG: class I poly(R)-hydroxyalkanoic acid synthase [Burkholderiaceae bacterium]|nr:class I poly(R)-hydroxyalkanoic acid synthase [Burkholderiaceae bacterium]
MSTSKPTQWPTPLGLSKEDAATIQNEFMAEWQKLSQSAAHGKVPPVADRRFKAEAWGSSPMHLMMAHLYLLSGEAMQKMVDVVQAPPAVKEKLKFSVMQWVDAMSPANYLATNPEAQKALIDSGGETMRAGMENFMKDLKKGRISHSDESKFEVGVSLANTAGQVVFKNKYFELIQYAPQTATVFQRPLLMVPPCINKFYILDLQPDNSFVRYMVGQGHTVFMVAWRNPLESDKDGIQKATWDDYLSDGILKAIEVVSDISGQSKINALGFCVGGTMLASALAVAAARKSHPVASVTLLTTMLDFEDAGVLGVFVDEAHASLREKQIGEGGLMSARELSNTFSFLRPNELVWNYVVSNYLKGETPVSFDLLYWNGDGTNLPGPFFTWYFRNMYLENKLCIPKALTCLGQKVDLGSIKTPTYLYASRDDHIVPWRSGYKSSSLLKGENRFVLGASGHIAGVINPPEKNRRNYWVAGNQAAGAKARSAEDWFDSATEVQGSWWPDYTAWLADFGGKKVKASAVFGNAEHKPTKAAPGTYVKVRAD